MDNPARNIELTDLDRIRLLTPPDPHADPVSIVLDTDTYNEIDDQFAIVHAMLSSRLQVKAIYAAPFANPLSSGPEEGMLLSYAEILRVLEHLGKAGQDPGGFAFEGSRQWMPDAGTPVDSPAANDLIERARGWTGEQPLYVVPIGAPTNVASALLKAPDIAGNIVVVWLGGNPASWHPGAEFNVYQDMHASRVLLDSGVALVHVPCVNVTQHLKTTPAEVDRFVRPCGALGAYLAEIFANYADDHFALSKEIWDVGTIAWLINPDWAPSVLIPSPRLNDDRSWTHDPSRHLIREVRTMNRDAIFGDLFRLLADHASVSKPQEK